MKEVLIILLCNLMCISNSFAIIGRASVAKEDSVKYYTNGKEVGEWKSYHDNGNLSSIGYFSAGLKTGEWKYYYKNGQLSSIGYYTNGKEVGEWKGYYDNGNLNTSGNYSANSKNVE